MSGPTFVGSALVAAYLGIAGCDGLADDTRPSIPDGATETSGGAGIDVGAGGDSAWAAEKPSGEGGDAGEYGEGGLDGDAVGGDAKPCPKDTVDGGGAQYMGYGTEAHIPCSWPSTCVFAVDVQWVGPACCTCANWPGHYPSCACSNGQILCNGKPPTNYCEFCCWDGSTNSP